MRIITRHSLGGYRSVMSAILSESEAPEIKAQALQSAFVWEDHVLGAEFWHRNWGALRHGKPVSKEARNMIKAMAEVKPRTIHREESRDHDRAFLRCLTKAQLDRKFTNQTA